MKNRNFFTTVLITFIVSLISIWQQPYIYENGTYLFSAPIYFSINIEISNQSAFWISLFGLVILELLVIITYFVFKSELNSYGDRKDQYYQYTIWSVTYAFPVLVMISIIGMRLNIPFTTKTSILALGLVGLALGEANLFTKRSSESFIQLDGKRVDPLNDLTKFKKQIATVTFIGCIIMIGIILVNGGFPIFIWLFIYVINSITYKINGLKQTLI
jgi:hypothetical protein